MNTIMQLRKICNHPYMFQQIEVRTTHRLKCLLQYIVLLIAVCVCVCFISLAHQCFVILL